VDVLTSQDLEEMLAPLPGDSCGENCEYDDLYLALDTLAQGTPASEMGDSIIDGKDPDYRTLYKNCMTLWKKTRDLRVASFLTLSSLCIGGIEGLLGGLKVIDYLVTDLYDSFYPQLDPDDDNDPTERINILSMISPEDGAYADGYSFVVKFREIKLVPELPYTYRDYLVGTGFITAKEGNEVDINIINAQLSSIPVSSLESRKALVDEILALVKSITEKFNEKTGDTGYLTMTTLEHELNGIKNIYVQHLKNVSVPSSDEASSGVEPTANSVATAPQAAASPVQVQQQTFNLETFVPKTRNEALLLLKKSSEYFEKAEPTSPVPFLINRALKMSNMNFIDLLGEIDRDALSKGREQLGVPNPDD